MTQDWLVKDRYYVGLTEAKEDGKSDTFVLDNVIGYKESNNFLTLALTLPSKATPEYLITWLSTKDTTTITIVREYGENNIPLTTDHKISKVAGYTIEDGIYANKDYVLLTVTFETSATVRVGSTLVETGDNK